MVVPKHADAVLDTLSLQGTCQRGKKMDEFVRELADQLVRSGQRLRMRSVVTP